MIPIRDKVRNATNSPLNNSGLLFLISLAGIPIREGRMIPIRFGSSVKDSLIVGISEDKKLG